MSKTKLNYLSPPPLPTVKIKQNGFNFYINSVSLKRKFENTFHQVINEIMANDGIVEIETRQMYGKSFKYDERYIDSKDIISYLTDIFKENGFDVTFEYDNNI